VKNHEEEEEESGEEEVSNVLRLHVIAKIYLPYKYHPTFVAVKAKIRGYKSVLDDSDPVDVCTASLASFSSSGSLTTLFTRNWMTAPPRLEWKPP
jgi:hypothetical protein